MSSPPEPTPAETPAGGVLAVVCDIPFFPGKMGVDFFNLRHLARSRHVGIVGPRYDVLPQAGVDNLRRSVGSCYFWPDPLPALPPDVRPGAGERLGGFTRLAPRALKRRLLYALLGLRAHDENGLLKLAILANLAPYILKALAERPWQALVVIQSDTRAWLDYLPPHLPAVVYFHDVRSDYLERRARYDARGRSRRRAEARRARREEREICARADAVGFVSELDRQRAQQGLGALPGAAVAEIPLDLDYYASTSAPDAARAHKVVLFTGLLAHPPNQDAARYFLDEVWERVRHDHPDAVFRIVGAFPSRELRDACEGRPGVELHADVPDIRPFFREASVYVVPMRFGGGVRQKVLEAWAMHVPIVLTAMAAEGCGAEDGVNCLIANDAAGLARRVNEVLHRPRAANALVHAGRARVERHHALDVAAAQFQELVAGGIARRRARPFRAAIDLGWLLPGDRGVVAADARGFVAALAELDGRHAYRLLAPAATFATLQLPGAFRARRVPLDSWRTRLRARRWDLANRLGSHLGTHVPMGTALRRLSDLHRLDCDFVHTFQGAPGSDVDLLPQVRSLHTVVSAVRGDEAEERERGLCRRARALLCPSAVTRQEVHERWGVPLERLRVAYPGPPAPPPRRPHAARAACRRAFELRGAYALVWVDGAWPEALVEGLARATAELPPALGWVVVSATPPPPGTALAARVSRVLYPGDLTPHARWGLLTEAEVTLRQAPLLDFDPVLAEMLRIGVPLVLGDTPLARELAGPHAVYAEIGQAEEWGQAVVELGRDGQRRAELARAAQQRGAPLSWRAHAQVALAVYEELHESTL